MLEFFLKLKKGIKSKDILKSQKEIVDNLILLNIIKRKDTNIKIDSKFLIGKVDISRNGTGYITLLNRDSKDLIVEKSNLNMAQKGDTVLIKRSYNKRGRASASVVYIIQKEFTSYLVYLVKKRGSIVAYNLKSDIQININVKQKALKELPKHCVLKIDGYSGDIIEVLGPLDDENIDEQISLALYERDTKFNNTTIQESHSFGESVDKSMYLDRVDLCDLNFCTIDPNSAKDFDDAIYYDKINKELYIAIADVSEYVNEYSSLDTEAKKRGFSIYFPHKSIPMLPRALSENICSLKPKVDRLAFVYKIKFDTNFNIISSELFEAIINSKRRYTYNEIDAFLNKSNNHFNLHDTLILKWLIPLYDITKKIRANRLKKGYDFRTSDISMSIKDGILTKTTKEASTPSHELIEECMLIANKLAASNFEIGIFRNHDEPSYEKIDTLFANFYALGIDIKRGNNLHKSIIQVQHKADTLGIREEIDKMIIRAQQQAFYSHINTGHFGLGFDKYTHFTSPIRRYSDLILHRLLKAKIINNKKKIAYLSSNIEATTSIINEASRVCTKVEFDFMDRKFARWAKSNIDKEFDAIIIDNTGTYMIAKIEDTNIFGARVFVYQKDVLLYEKVRVKIVDSNIATTKIKAKIVS